MKTKKVRLPKNVRIYTNGIGRYFLVYEKDIYTWFPTISELKDIEKILKKLIRQFPNGKCFNKECELFPSGDKKENNLGFGIEFTCDYLIDDFQIKKYKLYKWN